MKRSTIRKLNRKEINRYKIIKKFRYKIYLACLIYGGLTSFISIESYIDGKNTSNYIDYFDELKDGTIFLNAELISDYSFLINLPIIKSIQINKAEFLTDEDINIINNANIENIYLFFDLNNVMHDRDNSFDISRFKANVTILNNTTNNVVTEHDNLVFFNYLKGYTNYNFKDQDYYNYYYNLNSKLIDVILTNYLDEKFENEEDKFKKIANFVAAKIQYDKNVSNETNKVDNIIKQLNIKNSDINDILNHFLTKKYIRKLINYYNAYPISSVIDQGKEHDGICANYAELFDIICSKEGYKVRLVIGDNHGWNEVFVNDKPVYIDVTMYDSDLNNENIESPNFMFDINSFYCTPLKKYRVDELEKPLKKDLFNNKKLLALLIALNLGNFIGGASVISDILIEKKHRKLEFKKVNYINRGE